MKKILKYYIIVIIGCVFFQNCKQMPDRTRFVLFVFCGNQTAPVYPVYIYTNEKDTTYLKYCKMESRGTIYIGGFPLSDIHMKGMKKYHVNDSVFDLVSEYIIKNDTKAKGFKELGASGNYWVFFQDGKDSTIFALEGEYGACESCVFFEDLRKIVPEFYEY